MYRKQWRSIWLTLVLAVLLVFTAGCQMMEPEPTPSPAEVAEAIYWLASEKSSFSTGNYLDLTGGL